MQTITLDFTGYSYPGQIEWTLKKIFGISNKDRISLDALWDYLSNYKDRIHMKIAKPIAFAKEYDGFIDGLLYSFERINEVNPNITFEVVSDKEVMQFITLDFTKCKYVDQIHEILKREFKFPDYYGKNLDALWDCLGHYYTCRLHVYIVGLSTLTDEFKEYMNKILKIFDDVHRDTPNVTFEVLS